MKKVLLVTWFNSVNYGTCLQAYALSHKLKQMGYDVRLLDRVGLRTIFSVQDFFRKIRKKIQAVIESRTKVTPNDSSLSDEYTIRIRKKELFISENLQIIAIDRWKDYQKLNDVFDIFITGSDQIWNPYYLSPICMLHFVDKDKKKIAYASSVGVSEIPNDMINTYQKYLSRFDAISVREESSREYLAQLIGRDVKTALDPTFLLSAEEIRLLAEKSMDMPVKIGEQAFILCYFVGENMQWVEQVKKLAEVKQLPVYVIMSENRIIPSVGTPIASAGIYDFLWMLEHAEYICTDSFHCSALSINLKKEFLVFRRFSDGKSNSQNSRIYSLLEMLTLEYRLISPISDIQTVADTSIPYDKVMDILDLLREESRNYLIDALYNPSDV